MIHVVFQEADVEVLQKAIDLDPTLSGDIRLIRDDYATGPIADIFETEGYQARRDWIKSLLEASPYDTEMLMNLADDRMTLHQLKKALDEESKETVWIWMGQNAHDVCGYFWMIAQLQDYQDRIVVLYMNNLPFINEKGQIFYPTSLFEIQPKEFLKAKKLNRKVTTSEFEVDGDEWKRLSSENHTVRILEGGKKIAGKDADFYDKDVIGSLSKEWLKGNKAMHQVLSKMKIKTGDVFLLWRMRQLAEEGKLQINGDPAKGWKDFEVRLPAAADEIVETINEPAS